MLDNAIYVSFGTILPKAGERPDFCSAILLPFIGVKG